MEGWQYIEVAGQLSPSPVHFVGVSAHCKSGILRGLEENARDGIILSSGSPPGWEHNQLYGHHSITQHHSAQHNQLNGQHSITFLRPHCSLDTLPIGRQSAEYCAGSPTWSTRLNQNSLLRRSSSCRQRTNDWISDWMDMDHLNVDQIFRRSWLLDNNEQIVPG